MARPVQAIVFLLALLACSGAIAQESKDLLIATRRSGEVELIDPSTLATVSRIYLDFGELSRVFASEDGSMLYLKTCCALHTIDLATLRTNVVPFKGSAPARVWTESPGRTEIERDAYIPQFGLVSGCRFAFPVEVAIAAGGGHMFIYEVFGSKGDRRPLCRGQQVPGGAWMVNPDTGQFLNRVASDLHFSTLIPDRTGSVWYGLASESYHWNSPKLVRVDAWSGEVLQTRLLEPQFWSITLAPLRADLVPTGAVRALP